MLGLVCVANHTTPRAPLQRRIVAIDGGWRKTRAGVVCDGGDPGGEGEIWGLEWLLYCAMKNEEEVEAVVKKGNGVEKKGLELYKSTLEMEDAEAMYTNCLVWSLIQ